MSNNKKPPFLKFDNTYTKLPEAFYERINPTPVNKPEVLLFNKPLAQEISPSLTTLSKEELACIFSGNLLLPGSHPLALAYAGHQFGHFVPQLGDGRAILLGEIINSHGMRQDIQLKGAGPTRFSRSGDGRSPLGPALREYILSEAMHALGIKTTRSLAVVKTGEIVYRETSLPGAILTRVAASHIRVGTFEYFSARQEMGHLKTLADYVIDRHYPEVKTAFNPYVDLLKAIADAQAFLMAKWLQVGFIHGVMNTDNTSIAGETIDYGPCAFMDAYHPATVYSSIDTQGRYAFGNQPFIAQWNLERLVECLIPLLHKDPQKALDKGEEIIEIYQRGFNRYWYKNMGAKLGIQAREGEDLSLIHGFLDLLKEQQADYTLSFYHLRNILKGDKELTSLNSFFQNNLQAKFNPWLEKWWKRLSQENLSLEAIQTRMSSHNPLFIPRNHRVNKAIREAETHNDLSEVKKLLSVLSNPYNEQPENKEYMLPPTDKEKVHQTFCGT